MTNDVMAADGRVIGERALATRRRLLDATVAMLERDGVLDLKVVDITREIGMAAATFYQYFADVDAAILALAEEAIEDERVLVEHLEPAWSTPADIERARAFIDAYAAYFADHDAVLRVLYLKAEEGDVAFRAARSSANLLPLRRMTEIVKHGKVAGRVSAGVDPFAASAGMLAMIERLLAYQNEIRRRGTSKKAMRETLSTILFQTLTGIAP
jgi:AcrR family transcriptional regulator